MIHSEPATARHSHSRHAGGWIVVVTTQAAIPTLKAQATRACASKHIEDDPLSWILCGDLNDTAAYPTYGS